MLLLWCAAKEINISTKIGFLIDIILGLCDQGFCIRPIELFEPNLDFTMLSFIY